MLILGILPDGASILSCTYLVSTHVMGRTTWQGQTFEQ